MNDYSLAQYRRDAGTGLGMAVAFCAYTALPLGILGLVNLWHMLGRQALETPWATYGAVVAVVWSSYLIAGQLGAGAYFLLRPLRKWTVGWVLTDAALATAIYGTIGYMLAIFYEPVGRQFLEHSTRAEAWRLAHSGTWFFTVIGLYSAAITQRASARGESRSMKPGSSARPLQATSWCNLGY